MKAAFSFFRNPKTFFFLIVLLSIPIDPAFSQNIGFSKTDTTRSQTEPQNIDIKIFRSINNYRTSFLDNSLTITDNSVLPAALVIPWGTFFFGRAYDKAYDENTGFLLGTSELVNLGFTFGMKYLVRRPRPYESLKGVHRKEVSAADRYSFPSGHTSTTFAISTMFALRYPSHPQIYIPLYLWSIVVGYGRVYFGMHYPTDILGGAVLGALSSVAVYSLRNHLLKFKNQLLGEENRPDRNGATAKSMGMIAGVYFMSITANELLKFKTYKFNIELSPTPDSNRNSWQLNVKLKL